MQRVLPSSFSFVHAAVSLPSVQMESLSDWFPMKNERVRYHRFAHYWWWFRFGFSESHPSDDLLKVCLCHFWGEHSLVPMLDPSRSPIFLYPNVFKCGDGQFPGEKRRGRKGPPRTSPNKAISHLRL